MMRYLVLFMALTLTWAALAENIVFPNDAGMVDVTQDPYNLVGDNSTDNTEALQRAFLEWRGLNRTLYFPNGAYLFSGRINISGDTPSVAHSQDRFLNLQGQSEEGVILKLKDSSPGYGNSDSLKTFISLYDGERTADLMHAYVRNLTVEIGQGNPGAVALRYATHNTGAMYNVTIRSVDSLYRGAIGLDLRQKVMGPGLMKNITVDGFDYGVHMDSSFSMVFEHITLRNQQRIGFYNFRARTTLRELTSDNSVPAIVNEEEGELILIDSRLSGQGEAAIVAHEPKVFCRDVDVNGYTHAVQTSTGGFVDGDIEEWYEGTGHSLFGASLRTLRLPIQETPTIPWETDLSKWVKIEEGSDRIQAAIDQAAAQGATTVYFPKLGPGNGEGRYSIASPVRVHGSVNRILGMENMIDIADPSGIFQGDSAVFTFENLSGDVLIIERFFGLGGWNCPDYLTLFENKSAKTIVLANVSLEAITKKPDPGGTWFFEDVAPGRESTLAVSSGESIWARQFNPETYIVDMVDVDGGMLWILGFKTEGRTRHIIARNGANVEILGGVSYQSWINQALNPPMFTIDSTSDVSITYGLFEKTEPFTTIVEETREGETRTLSRQDVTNRFLPIYRSGSSQSSRLKLKRQGYRPPAQHGYTRAVVMRGSRRHIPVPPGASKVELLTVASRLIRRYTSPHGAILDRGRGHDTGTAHGVYIVRYIGGSAADPAARAD